jgi:hypothetical protein
LRANKVTGKIEIGKINNAIAVHFGFANNNTTRIPMMEAGSRTSDVMDWFNVVWTVVVSVTIREIKSPVFASR